MVLASAETRLIHLAQAAAVAVGVTIRVIDDAEDVKAAWRACGTILVGADQAAAVASLSLPRRGRVYLLGQTGADDAIGCWSMTIGALVILLPQAGKWLSGVLAGRSSGTISATVVAVRSGCGGIGASTLSAALAVFAARRSLRVGLIDADPGGGGLDLMLGAEGLPGWRWDRLRQASGQIADITDLLPRVDGVTLVSMERTDATAIPPPAAEAVIDCLARTHDVVFIDLPRLEDTAMWPASRSILLAGQSVRSIAAARTSALRRGSEPWGLVVRKGGSVAVSEVARAVELPLVGSINHVRDLPGLADRGVPPMLGGRWRKACSQILDWCVDDDNHQVVKPW